PAKDGAMAQVPSGALRSRKCWRGAEGGSPPARGGVRAPLPARDLLNDARPSGGTSPLFGRAGDSPRGARSAAVRAMPRYRCLIGSDRSVRPCDVVVPEMRLLHSTYRMVARISSGTDAITPAGPLT